MPDKVYDLVTDQIDEISFVDRGGNQHAALLIHKSDGEEVEVELTDEVRKELEEAGFDVEAELAKMSPDGGDLRVKKPLGEDDEDEDEGMLSKVLSKMFGQQRKPPGLQGPPQMGMGMPQAPPQQQMPQMGGQFAQQPMAMNGMGGMGGQIGGAQAGNPFAPMQGAPGLPGQMPGMGAPDPSGGLAPLPQEALDYIKQLEEEVQRLSQDAGGSEDTGGNPFGKNEEFEDMSDAQTILTELAKSLESQEQSELVYKALDLVAEADERAATAETIAKAEREHRLNREFVELAKKYSHLPVSAEELGPVLKSLYEHLEEDQVAVVEKCFGEVNDVTAGLFTEVGKRGGYDTDIVSKVEAEANSLIEKSESGLSKEEAIDQVLTANPSMYDEYVRESTQLIREG